MSTKKISRRDVMVGGLSAVSLLPLATIGSPSSPPPPVDPYQQAKDAIASALNRIKDGQTLPDLEAQASMLDLIVASQLGRAVAVSQGVDVSIYNYTCYTHGEFVALENPLVRLIETGLHDVGINLPHGIVIIVAKLIIAVGGVVASILIPLVQALAEELNFVSLINALAAGQKAAVAEFLEMMSKRLTDPVLSSTLWKKVLAKIEAFLGKKIVTDKVLEELNAFAKDFLKKLVPGVGLAIFLVNLLIELFNQRDSIINGFPNDLALT